MNIVSEKYISAFKNHQLINKKSNQDLMFVRINHKIKNKVCCVKKLFFQEFFGWLRMFYMNPHYRMIIINHYSSNSLKAS
jgi:hypothetical protein